ncbi:Glycosyltransferase family 92 protein [Pseudohyphozyma bogoriensis]|nr:Glycosyltransferase family 92 protein [Pseudohyphozyma bogoriensis]
MAGPAYSLLPTHSPGSGAVGVDDTDPDVEGRRSTPHLRRRRSTNRSRIVAVPLLALEEAKSVAICASIKDQVFDLPEWFVHHYHHIGIRHFYIYDDGSNPPIANQLSLADLGIPESAVTFVYTQAKDRVVNQQAIKYEQCVRDYGSNHTWMMFIDADEFVEMTNPGESLHSFLKTFNDTVGVVAVNWNVHNSHNVTRRPPQGSCRSTFTTCIPDPTEERPEPGDNALVKAIARTSAFRIMESPHHVGSNLSTVGEDGVEMGDPRFLRSPVTRNHVTVHHYAVKSRQEFLEKKLRGSGMSNHKNDEFWDRMESSESVTCDSLARYWP